MKKVIPIARQIIKRQLLNRKKDETNKDIRILSIDEQIAALEGELNKSDDDDFSEDNNSESNESKDGQIISHQELIKGNQYDNSTPPSVLVNTSLLNERIPPLPPTALPKPGCTKKSALSKINDAYDRAGKRVKFSDPAVENGLQKTVNELLRNYIPTSCERKPFWCRICSFQGEALQDLENHRLSELHQLAERKERKISFCKLCRKQFTSPAQLKEHVKGKAHKERLDTMTSRQGKKFERT
eukprot:gene4891-9757_t